MMHRDVQAQQRQGRTAAVVHIRLKCTLVAEKRFFYLKIVPQKSKKIMRPTANFFDAGAKKNIRTQMVRMQKA